MDATFWATAALIVFIALIMYLKVPGMITKSLDDRADKIRSDLDEARKLREEAQALLAEYQRKRRDAESEAETIVEAAKREADTLAGDAKKKLDEYVERRTKMAEQKIAQAEAQAMQDVKAIAAERAIAASEQVLMSKLSDGGASLIKSSISEVKSKLM
ncbi:MAG: F0F1 ATP synthase subunit B [Hyphomicrobiales bacterium]